MTFRKSPLTVAVISAMALSNLASADIEITGTQDTVSRVIGSNLSAGFVVFDANINQLDIDIQDAVIPDGVIILNSTIDSAIIENNSGDIRSKEDQNNPLGNYGIIISGSTVGVTAEGRSDRELIVNTGNIQGHVDSDDLPQAPGIGILNSTISGDIINKHTSGVANVISGTIGLQIENSTLNGSIFNTDSFANDPNATPGDAQPVAIIQGLDSGIAIVGNSTVNGDIANSGYIIDDNGSGHAVEIISSNLNGNINNSGFLTGKRGINLYNSTVNGNIFNSGYIQADERNTDARGISINNTEFNGTITNTGHISGYRAVSITEGNTGTLVFNQVDGSLTGTEYSVLLNKHRFNYQGGTIKGKVANVDGTFYVEGNRVIDGDYEQGAAATLAIGLHTESSLTAANITLASGSRVLLDLSKGDIYLDNGESAEILQASSGIITATGVEYASTNSLVKIADAKINGAGNLEITVERATFQEAAQQAINSGQTTGQASSNLQQLGTALQTLNNLAGGNTEIAQMLNAIDTDNIDQLLPDVSGSATGATSGSASSAGGIVTTNVRNKASGDTFTKTGLWLQGLYADADQDDKNGVTGYDAETSGLVIGADGETDNGAVYGLAFSYAQTDSDTHDGNAKTSTDYYQLTGYWGYSLGNVLMDGQVYYGRGDNDARRNGIGGIAAADFDTSLYGAQLSAGYSNEFENGLQLTPRVSLEYSKLKADSYTETGTATGLLSVDENTIDRLELGLSIEASKTYQSNDMLISPRLSLGVFHDFEAEAQTITAAFQAAPDTSFTSEGADVASNRYIAAAGVEIAKGEDFTAQVEYNYNWKDSFDAHTGAVKLRWEF